MREAENSVFSMTDYLEHIESSEAHGVLIVKILNKCILRILVYNLFLGRQRNIIIHRNMSIQRYLDCLHEIEIQLFKTSDWANK